MFQHSSKPIAKGRKGSIEYTSLTWIRKYSCLFDIIITDSSLLLLPRPGFIGSMGLNVSPLLLCIKPVAYFPFSGNIYGIGQIEVTGGRRLWIKVQASPGQEAEIIIKGLSDVEMEQLALFVKNYTC